MAKSETRELLLSVFGVAILIIVITGVTYAIYNYTSNAKQENVITTGSIELEYLESDSNVIKIDNAIPVDDTVGKLQSEYFDFTLKATIAGVATINYDLYAKELSVENKLDYKFVKLYLEELNGNEYQTVLEPKIYTNTSLEKGMLLYSSSFVNTDNKQIVLDKKYRFRMWLDSNYKYDNISRSFKVKVNVYASV